MHFAYLDEFGHIGPYVSKDHDRHNTSPIFGLAGLILPVGEVRGFSTWFFQRKCQLLDFEIKRSGKHPAEWEKKGSSLFTTKNIEAYPELIRMTNRLLNKIERCGGRIIYVGMKKTGSVDDHNSQLLYRQVLREALKRLDQYCSEDCTEVSNMLIFMDEHQEREAFVTEASRSMFDQENPRRHLVEPPVQVESHRYQTLQAADWICGLIGRLEAYRSDPIAFAEFKWAADLFAQRIARVAVRSSIRSNRNRERAFTIMADRDRAEDKA